MFEFDGEFSANSVFWLSALREDEKSRSQTIIDDLKIVLESFGVPFRNYDAICPAHFETALLKIAESAANDGRRPILHLDMHGSKEYGLEIGATRECVPWPKVRSLLQDINKATGNNLCVLSASCFGLHVIREIQITQPAPFYLLIAPENEVSPRFLADHTTDFYRDVFLNGTVDAAFKAHLSGEMRVFHAERMLFISIARYIHYHCKGKGGAERRERLLSEVFLLGMERTPENLKAARQKIKKGLIPDQAFLNKYVQNFLVGKKPGFEIDDLLIYVEQSASKSQS